MDKAAAPKTYVKFPFGKGTIRALPLETRHIVSLSMIKHLKRTDFRLDILFGILADRMEESVYADVVRQLTAGDVDEKDVMRILSSLVDATKKQNTPEPEPAPEPEPVHVAE